MALLRLLLIILCFYTFGCAQQSVTKLTQEKTESTSCLQNLVHNDELTALAYKQAFSMFGAILLKYQEIIKSNKSVADEFKKISTGALAQELQNKNKTYFGIPINNKWVGDLAEIENKIIDKQVRTIWNSWCAHPDNFLSWLLYPVYHVKANNIDEYMKGTVGDYLKQYGHLLHWFDDGFWMVSNILGIKIGPAQDWTADPTKWLIEIKDNKPVTK